MSSSAEHQVSQHALISDLRAHLAATSEDQGALSAKIKDVVVFFEDPSLSQSDEVVLVRMGRGEALEDTLVEILKQATEVCPEKIAITSCAERFNSPQQHSFSALLERVSARLACRFINDNFRETKERPSMTTFPTAEGRREALLGVMEYDGRLDGMTVLLIDDVTTTGSSLITAGEVLIGAGASSVVPIALLRSPLNDPSWEREQTKRVIRSHFKDPEEVLRWAGATRALKEIAEEVIAETKSHGNQVI